MVQLVTLKVEVGDYEQTTYVASTYIYVSLQNGMLISDRIRLLEMVICPVIYMVACRKISLLYADDR